MSGNGGKRLLSELLIKPAEVISSNASLEGDSPGDTDYFQDDSASSDDSVSVLSQSPCKRRLLPSLKRENARQNFPETFQSNPDKNVSEWTIADVKKWALETFEDETIAQKFESEEVDGPILLSTTVRNNEAMEALGLTTIGKKGRFLEKTDILAGGNFGAEKKAVPKKDLLSVDRILTNAEKNQLTTADRSIYNTRKKKITNYVKQIWPPGSPVPKFRNSPEANKKLLQIVDKLAKDEEFSLPRLGLQANAITQIIRKHMDERRRKESESLAATGKLNSPLCSSESDTSASSTSRESTTDSEENKLEDYFNTDLTLASAEAIILVWLGKVNIFDVHLVKDLRPLAKSLGLKLLRNKDKTTHIRAIANVLLREGKVKTNAPLKSITKDDVELQK